MTNSTDEPNSKRQRVSRACDLCRRKKIKCDGAIPICGNCQAFSLECSYKDMTKKRGPPKGYIEAVENRLRKLEGLLKDMSQDNPDPKAQALIAELSQPLETTTGQVINTRPVRRLKRGQQDHYSRSTSPPHESPMSLSQICFADDAGSPSQHSRDYNNHHNSNRGNTNNNDHESMPSSPDSVGDSTGQLSMDENGQVRYLGKSSGYYLLQNSRTYQNGAFHFTGWGHKSQSGSPSRGKATTKLDPFELPPKDLSRHLINLYFEHFYPVLPLFYKKRLTSSLNSPLEPISPLLLNAIYAVASRVSPDVRVRADPASADTAGDVFFERAKRLLDDYYDVPRISTVQALLLLATHQHGTMKYVRGWLYSGMAFRMAQDLGLHRNCDHWNIPPDERERRKRVFWCCFVVDRLISAIYGRSSTFEERDCDVPFPTDDDEEPSSGDKANDPAKPRIVETFVHLIKITDIMGHVLRNVYYAKARHHASQQHLEHVLTGLNRELTNWYNRLPPALQYKPPNTESGETAQCPPLAIAQIHMFYYTTLILLHRPFIPGHSPQSPSSLPSYKICISAASSILDIVNVMFSENRIRFVLNYAVYCLFTAGIMFIKMASSDEAEKVFDAKIYINKIMRALDEIDTTWMNAARCCNILGELAGLRDINLECDEYVPRRNSRLLTQPPPSIAVPNSPQQQQQQVSADDQQQQNDSSQMQNSDSNANDFVNRKPGTTMDPFAAPDVVANAQQQYDPFHTAFWGVPSSLDVEEWNNYFGTQNTIINDQNNNNNNGNSNNNSNPAVGSSSANVAAAATSNTASLGGPSILSPSSAQPLIPSHEFSPLQQLRGPYSGELGNMSSIPQHQELRSIRQQRDNNSPRNLVHNDNVDILNGVSFPVDLPESPASSVLLGLLASQEHNQNR
ncbi:fungal-specific transcription factor domain-containing protein [Zychaea mexicana]|uniref:fungal-specific transcription factor domain-containing protein n=1 Tax=Zychaea mexicana TaxID=64656 RepID=UPI0022FE66AD|nr:fungal-specific transcription factor domain-containing protein [Zychaea mexicana]KAI9492146.1 fungal-specific transcription factor domain-containing protein [Zychaea mexicana]